MANEQKGLEIKVGLFVLIGLIIIASMAIKYGRVGQGLSKYYNITVEFPNAAGLFKNADVQMSGARIGVVAEDPRAVPGQVGTVPIKLMIWEGIELPRGCFFQVGSSGLLGDKSVVVSLPAGFDQAKFDVKNPKETIPHNSTVHGTQVADINELTSKGNINMEKLAETLDELKETLKKIQSGVLNDENMANLKDSFASIKASTDNIARASTKIDGVMTGAQSTVDSAKETFAEAKQAIGTINGAATDIRTAIADVRGIVASGQTVLKAAQNGPGALPMLLGNREVADNLSAVIFNIRKHGLLFYRDSASAPTPTPMPTQPKAKR
jgi:phospholipid/cholesterol/gamma-HCH transport system substrate-binding protein